ncbi:hypothetical protein [Catellatospora sichuanensis]|uniref:hypothetical protein n=1 Tax=Catellatospora sichuanensis TaxID=1969805 RepID=UPI001184603A|nr:hypothetical protein [Catellatospora sichuanensis]
MPAWVVEIAQRSPWVAGFGLVCYYGYRVFCKLLDSPLGVAALIASLGTKAQREDARELVRLLGKQRSPDDPLTGPPDTPE